MSIPGSVSPLFLGAAGQATGDYQISRSLRFNSSDSAYLSRTPSTAGDRRTFTWAGWIKRCKLGSRQSIFSAGTGNLSGNPGGGFYFNSSTDTLSVLHGGGSTANLTTAQVFRDVSAWFHLVVAYDTTQGTDSNRIKIYVNGTQITISGTYPGPSFQTDVNNTVIHAIGSRTDDGSLPASTADYYLADVHFIDGQALTPSSFTEVSATTGQLIPIAYTGSFGTNGFWLKFSDNSSNTATTLGKDTSGAGNNWTVNNISVYQGTTQGVNLRDSSRITLSGGKPGATDVTKLLDGVLNYADTFYNGNGSYISYSVSGLSVGSTIYIRYWNAAEAGGQTITATCDQRDSGGTQITGTAVSQTWTQGQKWNDGSGYIAQTLQSGVSTIRLTFSNNSNVSYGWGVGEIQFLDGSGNDSLVDSPTNYGTDTGAGGEVRGNYCTWNALDNAGTLANGNLDFSQASAAFRNVRSTFGFSSGKWYWEATLSAIGGAAYIGIGKATASLTVNIGGTDTFGYVNDGTKQSNNTSAVSYGATYTTGDVIGVAFDADNGTLTFYKNGTSQGQAYSGLTSGPYFMMVTGYNGTTWATNFGQRPFAYTAPSGFKALCDTNLTAPVIAKPNTVMDVVLYTGNNTGQSITGLGFSPDLVWAKARSNAYGHNIFDSVRGANKVLGSDVTTAEATATDKLTSFDSNGFTVGADQTVFGGINYGTGTYVAWAWDAGSSTVSNTQGSITSQVRANASAGFSVVTYTKSNGSSNSVTIGHGLNATPHLIITKGRNLTEPWYTYHHVLGNNGRVQLNETSAATIGTSVWGTTSPTSQVFTMLGVFDGNYVAYCFAPVDGYSSFGSYTGNGSADGPFVYTGFRPRWVMIKRVDNASGAWTIIDTSRDPYNVTQNRLRANSSAAEDGIYFRADFLSNGFKLRDNDQEWNLSERYIYAAFAESPFAYARAR